MSLLMQSSPLLLGHSQVDSVLFPHVFFFHFHWQLYSVILPSIFSGLEIYDTRQQFVCCTVKQKQQQWQWQRQQQRQRQQNICCYRMAATQRLPPSPPVSSLPPPSLYRVTVLYLVFEGATDDE